MKPATFRFLRSPALATWLAVTLSACEPPQPRTTADLVVTGARVWTGDPEAPWAEAVATVADTIVAVGRAGDMAGYVGEGTEVIEIPGSMVVPGFIDSHVHFATGGAGLASVQLRDAETPAEFTRRIGDFARTVAPGEWILAGTWDHENWGGELPHRDWIDAVTPEHPVWVMRLDGHMALANSLALSAAGVDASTADVEGGEIVRDADGRPTGILKDNAMALVESAVPSPGEALLERQVAAASAHVVAHGVTTVHDMAGFASLEAHRRARAAGTLRNRVYAVVPLDRWERLRDEVSASGSGDDWIRIGGLKGFMDGSLGSHTAAFLEPFTDAPGDRGFLVNPLEDMERWVSGADEAGLHVMVHAIGDRAIRDLLDIYERVAERNGPRDRRFRIEHAQHIHPGDLSRFAAQEIIASMQPYHAIDDGRWAENVIGAERAKTTYAFRSLIDSGARVAFGSDWFVAPVSPLAAIEGAVTRRTLAGAHPEGWVPEQKIGVEEALRAYTSEAAYASFEEDRKGRLAPGLLADFVVLDRDITEIPPTQISGTRVLRTIVGGEIVFSAPDR